MLAHYGRGAIAYKRKKWDEALEHFTKAYHAKTDRPETLYYLALTHYQAANMPAPPSSCSPRTRCSRRRTTSAKPIPDAGSKSWQNTAFRRKNRCWKVASGDQFAESVHG
ncbi:MAG: tetratricopeptide repeat protein [Chloroflexi bacterium]|uniref:tetratricopeptide repeat protein n=1 Tax=Candidatus Flexifilum breve TaxID=3140694 RepID=UPI0031346997|nr:tetratricopeptide repeat protein [Chloroflexota bacterium]